MCLCLCLCVCVCVCVCVCKKCIQTYIHAEISGAQSADRNLRDKIKTLDAESQKQQEHIYTADFQLQLMERKVARAQGNYRADEKEALNAKVAVL